MQPVPSRYETRQSLLMRIHQHEESGWLEFYEKYASTAKK